MSLWSIVSDLAADKPAVLSLKDGSEASHDVFVSKHVPEARSGYWFWNAPGLVNGHLQTLAASKPGHGVDEIYYGRRLMSMPDGGEVAIDYALEKPVSEQQWEHDLEYRPVEDLPPNPSRTRYLTPSEIEERDKNVESPLLITLHGLSGGSHEQYVRSTIAVLRKQHPEFECSVITSRGCNRTRLTSPRLFNAAWTDDIRTYVRHVRNHQPDRQIYLVGYSLGASILANYLGQEGSNSEISGAVVVACPWDLNLSTHHIEGSWVGLNVYGPAMARNLVTLVKRNVDVMCSDPLFKENWAKCKPTDVNSVRKFDNNFTAALFGFETASDYYRTASPINRLHAIRTPTLVLSSYDDPITGNPHLEEDITKNPFMHWVETTVGGHLGWYGMGGYRWSSNVIAGYVAEMHARVDPTKPVKAELHGRPRLFIYDRYVIGEHSSTASRAVSRSTSRAASHRGSRSSGTSPNTSPKH